ncbi:MAG: zinc dependent phospholipase C family protein [Coriobacteriales bacterium]|jgi:hypothetical protein|nr:zinc dependent phospholipase C family protein [Coriobacteriales bacterium]
MPAAITHYLFALDLLEEFKPLTCASAVSPVPLTASGADLSPAKTLTVAETPLPNKTQSTMRTPSTSFFARFKAVEERNAFILGNQGPDPLFFALRTPQLVKYKKFGQNLHKYKISDSIAFAKEYIQSCKMQGNIKEAAVLDAYVQGYLCHYVLDSIVHPFVYAQQYALCAAGVPGLDIRDGQVVHARIESDLDVWMLNKRQLIARAPDSSNLCKKTLSCHSKLDSESKAAGHDIAVQAHNDVSAQHDNTDYAKLNHELPEGQQQVFSRHNISDYTSKILCVHDNMLAIIDKLYKYIAKNVYGISIAPRAFTRCVADMRLTLNTLYSVEGGVPRSDSASSKAIAICGDSVPRNAIAFCNGCEMLNASKLSRSRLHTALVAAESRIRRHSLILAMTPTLSASTGDAFANSDMNLWRNPFTGNSSSMSFEDLFAHAQMCALERLRHWQDDNLSGISFALNFEGEPECEVGE